MKSRRNFIKESLAGSAVISLSGSVPKLILAASRPVMDRRDERILVVVQMTGGNDGLNTVVPFADEEYYKNRFTLAIGRNRVLKINDSVGLHPALKGFDTVLQDGKLSVIQGVGYPNPNRSHFESMDLWHTAHRIADDKVGWLGRTVDRRFSTADLPAMHFGNSLQPLALKTSDKPIPTLRSIDDFRLNVFRNRQTKRRLEPLITTPPAANNPLLSYVHESATVALETSHQLEGISNKSMSQYGYPQTNLGRNLGSIAQLIGSGLSTRIYYTTLDGFDTHSNQGPAHQALLEDLGKSMEAFIKQLKDQGDDRRVATLSFSEFGRRVRENASGGTDHGTAAPVFVFGPAMQQAVVGEHPSLSDLDQGDLKFHVDYRRVYASLLEDWLGIDSEPILGAKFDRLNLFGQI